MRVLPNQMFPYFSFKTLNRLLKFSSLGFFVYKTGMVMLTLESYSVFTWDNFCSMLSRRPHISSTFDSPPKGKAKNAHGPGKRQLSVNIESARKQPLFSGLCHQKIWKETGSVIVTSPSNQLVLKHWLTSRRIQMELLLNREVLKQIPN